MNARSLSICFHRLLEYTGIILSKCQLYKMSDPNLVTTYNFNGREYLIKMHVNNTILELVITDKQTGEDWQCCYEAACI